ncbi:hypothetical protein A1OK_21185 [Enterovibrio norvegicus FF-454]|uniref:Uncharacterized protein n=1 Tax=Enterovibrio norvegicus FF-454 TaxID=1185651 RepID=A0A1E5C710_9GAMM|nr:hypothetical protein [Enterovibrio norvegicus]OEE61308.1 hypothetical protein A1OK_21185 [Enterovibrio norvegicus FF-454]
MEDFRIEPTTPLKWLKGLKVGFSSVDATQRDQYSWVAKSPSYYVFTAEIDHQDKENNLYNHKKGTFKKKVPPMTKENGKGHISIRHAKELYDAARDAYVNKLLCHMMLTKGTKSGIPKGGVSAAVDGDFWMVTEFTGSIDSGFSILFERVSES